MMKGTSIQTGMTKKNNRTGQEKQCGTWNALFGHAQSCLFFSQAMVCLPPSIHTPVKFYKHCMFYLFLNTCNDQLIMSPYSATCTAQNSMTINVTQCHRPPRYVQAYRWLICAKCHFILHAKSLHHYKTLAGILQTYAEQSTCVSHRRSIPSAI